MLDAKLPDKRLMLPTTNDFQDVLPSVLPFFHIYGLTVSLISKLALGCKIVSLPKFEPEGKSMINLLYRLRKKTRKTFTKLDSFVAAVLLLKLCVSYFH